jgi:hypothetical protein
VDEPKDTVGVLTTADRLEIHELAARYGTTIGDRDWEGLEEVSVACRL